MDFPSAIAHLHESMWKKRDQDSFKYKTKNQNYIQNVKFVIYLCVSNTHTHAQIHTTSFVLCMWMVNNNNSQFFFISASEL